MHFKNYDSISFSLLKTGVLVNLLNGVWFTVVKFEKKLKLQNVGVKI